MADEKPPPLPIPRLISVAEAAAKEDKKEDG